MSLSLFALSTSMMLVLATSVWSMETSFCPREYFLPPPPLLVGPLKATPLKGAEKLFEGLALQGPESLVVEKGIIYTCLVDGRCVKIQNGVIKAEVPMTTHSGCNGTRETRPYCGRPVGIRRYNAKKFAVMDSFLGIFLVDFDKRTAELVLSSEIVVDGYRFGFLDDLDIVDNDTIIFSDASTRYNSNEFFLDLLEHEPSGRIIEYKMSTGELKVLADGLMLANGVQLHPDKQSVLFCEFGMARVHRYYFSGPKRGRRELFVANLPGFPDNIRLASGKKTFYIALFSLRDTAVTNFLDWTAQRPSVRKVIGEIATSLSETKMFQLLGSLFPDYGIVVEVDLNGQYVKSWHDPKGAVIRFTSEVVDDGQGNLYLGSFSNNYIGRIKMN